MRGTRSEVSTRGFDGTLQGVGSGFDASPYNIGLIIPTGQPTVTPIGKARYTFMLCRTSIQAGQKTRLVGLRQMLTIGTFVEQEGGCLFPLETLVTSPFWRFSDGSVSWSLRRIPSQGNLGGTIGGDSFGLVDAQTPALIGFAKPTFAPGDGGVPSGATYVPPNAIPGTALDGDLGNFVGLRWPWHASQSYFSMDYEIQGPCDIAMYATVKQTNPETRCALATAVTTSQGVSPEDSFVSQFENVVYRRIAGAMIFEEAGAAPCP